MARPLPHADKRPSLIRRRGPWIACRAPGMFTVRAPDNEWGDESGEKMLPRTRCYGSSERQTRARLKSTTSENTRINNKTKNMSQTHTNEQK